MVLSIVLPISIPLKLLLQRLHWETPALTRIFIISDFILWYPQISPFRIRSTADDFVSHWITITREREIRKSPWLLSANEFREVICYTSWLNNLIQNLWPSSFHFLCLMPGMQSQKQWVPRSESVTIRNVISPSS
jgi:hypothetical protein